VYSTCIFCHADLGKNESVEHFAVGRRLAFDAPRGRLWVVCRKCERWNLTPLEERWEAIEECERLFRGTKLRVSTEHVGLARIREGLELVRIGAPLRPEMAAWRYGDQFGRRRRRSQILLGATVAVAGVSIVAPLIAIISVGGSAVPVVMSLNSLRQSYRLRRVVAHVELPGYAGRYAVRLNELGSITIAADNFDWHLVVPHDFDPGVKLKWHAPWTQGPSTHHSKLTGDAAAAALARLLPLVNGGGGRTSDVSSAVDLLETTPGPEAIVRKFASAVTNTGYGLPKKRVLKAMALSELPVAARLALEMATHEESERRALEGELHVLEQAWKDAEEIAAIADDLLVPEKERAQLALLKRNATE
jgi:hypothetical protein